MLLHLTTESEEYSEIFIFTFHRKNQYTFSHDSLSQRNIWDRMINEKCIKDVQLRLVSVNYNYNLFRVTYFIISLLCKTMRSKYAFLV